MTVLGFTAGLLLLIGAGVIAWLVVRKLRESATLRRTLDVVMLEVRLPKDITDQERREESSDVVKEKISVAEQFLSTLSNLPTTWKDRLIYGRPHIVFEIVARGDGLIHFLAGSERRYVDHMEKQIYALFPDADVQPAGPYTIFESHDTVETGMVSLRAKGHLPIATYRELEADPMQSLTGAMARLREGDAAVIQYVSQPTRQGTRKKSAEGGAANGARIARRYWWIKSQTNPGSDVKN